MPPPSWAERGPAVGAGRVSLGQALQPRGDRAELIPGPEQPQGQVRDGPTKVFLGEAPLQQSRTLCPSRVPRLAESGTGVTGQGQGLQTARGQGEVLQEEEILPGEAGEALELGAQSSCGSLWIPGSVQGRVGWDLEEPGTRQGWH